MCSIVDFPCSCDIHYQTLREYFVNVTILVLIYSWCKKINRILAGKVQYVGEDDIEKTAHLYYNKHNKIL